MAELGEDLSRYRPLRKETVRLHYARLRESQMVSILEHLQGVRKTGPDKHIARCPAHADKRPSLTIRELSDGRVLLHCFAGCDTEDVLAAVGLTFSDIMPERLGDFPRVRPAFTAADALRALSREAGVIAVSAGAMAEGECLSPEDQSRVCLAAGRIAAALEFVYGD